MLAILAETGTISIHHNFDALRRVQDYGAYLEADAIAAAASCREMEWALQEVFRLAEQCSDYKSNERYQTSPPVDY